MNAFSEQRVAMGRDAWLTMVELRGCLAPTEQLHFAKYLLMAILESDELPEVSGSLQAALELLDRMPSQSPLPTR